MAPNSGVASPWLVGWVGGVRAGVGRAGRLERERALALYLCWTGATRAERVSRWAVLTGRPERAFYRRLREGFAREGELVARWVGLAEARAKYDEKVQAEEMAERRERDKQYVMAHLKVWAVKYDLRVRFESEGWPPAPPHPCG